MLCGTISGVAALHAPATVGCTKWGKWRAGTLAILVALVADAAVFVATVRPHGTFAFLTTGGKTAIGELVADEASSAVAFI